jgi:hypothetical protein
MTTLEDVSKNLKRFHYNESDITFVSDVKNSLDVYKEVGDNSETFEQTLSYRPYIHLAEQYHVAPEDMTNDDLLCKVLGRRYTDMRYTPADFVRLFKNIPSTKQVSQKDVAHVFDELKKVVEIPLNPRSRWVILDVHVFDKETSKYYKEALKRPTVLTRIEKMENDAKLLHNIITRVIDSQSHCVKAVAVRVWNC